ncbi:MAG: polysaccharide deacetylase family protein, partial [Clostridia bacterium]|nr:polysaccharide deacetylase family protein [Clostridia bacterium]
MQPTRLLAGSAAVPEEKRDAAYACYYAQVVAAQTSVNALSFLKEEDAEGFVRELPRASLVLFHIDNAQAGLLNALTWLTSSLRETDLSLKAGEMLTQNAGQEAQAVNHIYTTERAVAYTFSGLGNDKELSYLLDTLDKLSAKALFFVTTAELQESQSTVQKLLSRGHDVGLGVRLIGQTTARQLLSDLLLGRELLKSEFGYQEEVTLARPVYGHLSDELREAASAGGFTLLMARANPVKSSDARETSAEAVFEAIYSDAPHMLQRGDVLHFTMNQYSQSDTLLGDLALLIHQQRNLYGLHSAAKMVKSELCYAYPLSDDAVLPSVRGRIHPGQLQGGLMKAMRERYIGSHWVNTTGMLPGFIRSEIAAIDKKGAIPNDSNMVFLSFDDWGTDGTITKLLDVLKKHDVIATFFVYTGNVVYNPNLLRAIAMEGHTIGCHT